MWLVATVLNSTGVRVSGEMIIQISVFRAFFFLPMAKWFPNIKCLVSHKNPCTRMACSHLCFSYPLQIDCHLKLPFHKGTSWEIDFSTEASLVGYDRVTKTHVKKRSHYPC